MADPLLTSDHTLVDDEPDDEPGEDFTARTIVDERDIPRPHPLGQVGPLTARDTGARARVYPVAIVKPLPTYPGVGRILAAGRIDLANGVAGGGAGQGARVGITASRVGLVGCTLYLSIETAAVWIAGLADAMPANRASLPVGRIDLPGVAEAYLWADVAGAAVSWMAVGQQ